MYTYKAICTKVYDGDTITVDIDLGYDTWIKKQKVRLYGINTPEIRGVSPEEKKEGFKARDRVKELILDKEITIITHQDKKGKYGRWLGEIKTAEGLNVNQALVEEGLAEVNFY